MNLFLIYYCFPYYYFIGAVEHYGSDIRTQDPCWAAKTHTLDSEAAAIGIIIFPKVFNS